METPAQPGGPGISPTARPALVDWSGVGLFLLLTFVISWSLFLGLRLVGVSLGIRGAAGMFGPALSALLTRLIRHEGFADAGLRLRAKGLRGAGWMYLAAYVMPPVLIAASIGFALLVGYQHWDLGGHLQKLAEQLRASASQTGMSATQLATVSLIVQTVLAFTFALPFNMLFTFGEESGWRGYLLPRLAPLGGVRAALLVGPIWGLWHAPVIVLDNYNYPGHPWLGILLMMLFCTQLSITFTWLRFRSGSVWPSTLAHAAYNAQTGFGLLFLSAGDSLLEAPIGLIGLVPGFVFAIFLIVTGRLKPSFVAMGHNGRR